MRKNYIPGKKIVFACIFGVLALSGVYSQNSFSRGEALFLDNNPQEALQYLEAAARDDPAHVQAFIYLGIAYQQLDRIDDAIEAYQKILPRGGAETARIAFNLGNAYFLKKDFSMAVQSYTRALQADPGFSTAYLNRANSRIQERALQEAVSDYLIYLNLEPRTPQRSQIERIISFIREEFAAEERRIQEEKEAEERRIEEERIAEELRLEEERIAEERRLEEIRIAEERRLEEERIAAEQRRIAEELRLEEERIAAEQRRIAEEIRRQEEEELARLEAERRQRMLEEISASLQAAAEDSKGLSAGNEGVQGYEGEFELE